MGINTHHVK